MANFRKVNAAIKKVFPNLNIEVVRGEGYIYFDGEDTERQQVCDAADVSIYN